MKNILFGGLKKDHSELYSALVSEGYNVSDAPTEMHVQGRISLSLDLTLYGIIYDTRLIDSDKVQSDADRREYFQKRVLSYLQAAQSQVIILAESDDFAQFSAELVNMHKIRNFTTFDPEYSVKEVLRVLEK